MNLESLHAVESRIAALDGRSAQPASAETAAFAGAVATAIPARISAGTLAPGRRPTDGELATIVRREAAAAGVDPRLVRAVIAAESGGDPRAVSSVGAAGAMQLMPETARALGVVDRFDLAQNVRGGTRYLRSLLDRFGGDVPRAVAAYNAGPGAVERYGGVPPYAETRRYVARVLASSRD